MAENANSTPAPSAPPPNTLEALIDALIPLADDLMDRGTDDQREALHTIIACVADLALAEDVLSYSTRLKARAVRLIYAGHPKDMEGGLEEDALHGGSRAENLILQVIGVLGASK
jgi:hypothetical protein